MLMGPRSSLFHALLAVLLLFLSCSSSAERLGNETDRLALLEFRNKITGDPLGVLNSWNHTVHFCRWRGVTCGRRHQRVVALELDSSKLQGTISPHLGNLSFLKVLNLNNNSYGNEIPHEIWHLGRLESFQLMNNSLVGAIPSNISCSSKLKVLHLLGNHLSGEMPDMIGCFSRLQYLQLGFNSLTGKIPPSLGNLSSLQVLHLGDTSMTGTIPESLGQLKNLEVFYLPVNGFSGYIPSSIFNLSRLRIFDVLLNQFEGSLPADLGTKMSYLESVFMFGNRFTGRIPPSISNATHLSIFSTGKNGFIGSIPSLNMLNNLRVFSIEKNHFGSGGGSDLSFLCSLVNTTNLQILTINGNNFGGVIPECIGNLSNHIRVFGLERNNLWGKIPATITNLINLEWLSFFHNQFSGHIPSNMGDLKKLQHLFLSRNHLSGSIPSSFGNLKSLIRLTMGNNNLHGSIPHSLGECDSLIGLDCSDNKLNGSIPAQLFNLAPFSIGLYLSGNRLTGDIPSQVGNLKNIGVLDVSGNLLSGAIPSSIGSCTSLELLSMSENFFQGTIPSSLSSLRGLQLLNLSNNKLTGEIPRFLVSLKLYVLDLSHNDFEGSVPSEGIFLNASAISLTGNNKLCGGIAELHLLKCSFHQSNKIWRKIILIICLTLGATFVVSIVLVCCLRRKKNKPTSSELPHQLPELSYHALFKATNGFSSTNLLGVGSFGSVYKGVIDEGKKLIAIKVLNLLQQGAYKSFMAECEALKNVRHRNLMKILTVCSSIDHHGNDFKALVYELMSNGSLDEWLHGKLETGSSDQRPKILSLLQRVNIAIDVASALDYLHNQCATPIVHCDLKPSNVLLNDDMIAHLGDFGLARFLPAATARGSLHNESSSIGIKGSIGYTAPEYGTGSEISTNGDVYSYGVLLLEMLIGKRPTDEMFRDGLNLYQHAKGVLSGNMSVIFYSDQELSGISIDGPNRGNGTISRIQESLISLIEIGVACSSELPSQRMNMSDVVARVSYVKGKLLETRVYRSNNTLGIDLSSID